MAVIVNTWKSVGHKVVVSDDNKDTIIHSNQPGTGEENTTDEDNEEADDFIPHQHKFYKLRR
jgi:hypothetical protein